MGQSQAIVAQIEIQASPETVRSVYMDFPRYKEWTNWKFEPVVASKTSSALKPKDKLKVDLGSMKFEPAIVENTSETFQWLGELYGVFSGHHEFYWTPSTKTPGGTTFLQKETFTGLLAFLMGPGWSPSKSTIANWDGFNADLKKEAERLSSQS
ncbi:activator of hsp90 ATPase 1 family protein [Seiridium cupressi]